jgi:hypothetical protein
MCSGTVAKSESRLEPRAASAAEFDQPIDPKLGLAKRLLGAGGSWAALGALQKTHPLS